jgi:ATP-dependent Clp endopeptidase proteolytic subunit ClpP
MLYTVDINADEPIMLINKHIGFDSADGPGIIGDLFQRELLQLDSLGKKRIQVWINSPGGSVSDGYAIYNAILKSNTPVDTYCVGMAASIAAVIFQAGRKRIMADYGILMYHNPFIAGGSITPSEKKMLDVMRESIITMICTRCGMDEKEMGYIMDRTTFIDAPESKEKNLCDEIESSVDANLKYVRRPDPQNMVHYFKAYQPVLNKICYNNTTVKNTTMLKVCMKLGLNEAATEDNVVSAIKAIEDKSYAAELARIEAENKFEALNKASKKDLDKLKAEMEEMDAKYKAKQKEYEECKAALDAMEKDKKEAEDKAKEIEAKNMIEGYAKLGRIKNEASVILKWTNLAKVDFDGTKDMLEAIPVNKEAAKIVIDDRNNPDPTKAPASALGYTARVINKLKNK